LNFYVYVGDDPVNGRDPTGRWSDVVCHLLANTVTELCEANLPPGEDTKNLCQLAGDVAFIICSGHPPDDPWRPPPGPPPPPNSCPANGGGWGGGGSGGGY
jgi:hypothetical protein